MAVEFFLFLYLNPKLSKNDSEKACNKNMHHIDLDKKDITDQELPIITIH